MEKPSFVQKLKAKKGLILKLVGGVALLMVGIFLAKHFKPSKGSLARWMEGFGVSKVASTYGHALETIQDKVDSLRQAEQENERFRLENANLRLRVEALQFDCHAKEASHRTREHELKLSEETGSRVGRVLATINYKPPAHLLPSQLYTLGVSYLKAREEEKAAVIFTFLTGLEDNETYKTPKNHLITGVSWYKLDNYEIADTYFEKVVAEHATPENIPYQAQARLWRALVAERTSRHNNAQKWLNELIDHHPKSTEAGWVNSRAPLMGKHGDTHAPAEERAPAHAPEHPDETPAKEPEHQEEHHEAHH